MYNYKKQKYYKEKAESYKQMKYRNIVNEAKIKKCMEENPFITVKEGLNLVAQILGESQYIKE